MMTSFATRLLTALLFFALLGTAHAAPPVIQGNFTLRLPWNSVSPAMKGAVAVTDEVMSGVLSNGTCTQMVNGTLSGLGWYLIFSNYYAEGSLNLAMVQTGGNCAGVPKSYSGSFIAIAWVPIKGYYYYDFYIAPGAVLKANGTLCRNGTTDPACTGVPK